MFTKQAEAVLKIYLHHCKMILVIPGLFQEQEFFTIKATTQSRVVHNFGSTVAKPIEIAAAEIPAYDNAPVKRVVEGTGLVYAQALFGTKDKPAKIIDTLERLSKRGAEDIIFWTPSSRNGQERAVGFGYGGGGFCVGGGFVWGWGDVGVGRSREMTLATKTHDMKRHKNLYQRLCSYDNLESAFNKARKRKTQKPYVIEFENNLTENLEQLQTELLLHSYAPKPLETFIVRDPKTRKISKSDFRDRVVHHAVCNIVESILEKQFIYDSFANRINKGTLKAVERFEQFKRKVSRNNTRKCYVLKADIKHYFDEIDHEILLTILGRSIADNKVIWLIKKIISNCSLSLSL